MVDHNDVVTVGNQTSILQKVMSAQWESKADAKVSYHELKLTEDAAQSFTLTTTHTPLGSGYMLSKSIRFKWGIIPNRTTCD